jgi:hypothetical protein
VSEEIMDILEKIERIKTADDLADFVAYLRDDLADDLDSWENPTLERFLDAMEAWLRDARRYNEGIKGKSFEPSWKMFADILYAAKIYE